MLRINMFRINITLTESGDIASLRITVTWTKVGILHTRNLKLTWTIYFEMICVRRRIIGLLQSQDLDGKPTFGFIVTGLSASKLMHSWGFALREGVFAEAKEGKCKNKRDCQRMNCFILRLREEASCCLLSKTTDYLEDQRGLLRRKILTGASVW